MNIIFVSECQKQARQRTVRILDSFAERIGHSTWKTRITWEGLTAAKRLLAKHASRHTAVACHQAAGKTGLKLLWVVGNRRRFNPTGVIPTNHTSRNLLPAGDNDWFYMEILKVCVALAGLFHDWGKAWDAFQDILRSRAHQDYIRHEYVSLMLWAAFVRKRPAEVWLEELCHPARLDQQPVIDMVCSSDSTAAGFSWLEDDLAGMIGWLIISHHKQPVGPRDAIPACTSPSELLSLVRTSWGYLKQIPDEAPLQFSQGLPCHSPAWQKQAARWAERGLKYIRSEVGRADFQAVLTRPLAHLARTALIVGDHEASRQAEAQPPAKGKDAPTSSLWAKSIPAHQLDTAPVLLEDHLVAVTREALGFCHFYPYLENGLSGIESARAIQKRATGAFTWQDRAADHLRKALREEHPFNQGFIGLNMASTGTGKTFANAKLIHALQNGNMRYTLALGLRSLTLQTGDEYRQRIGLDDTELAVVIGSKAVRELHQSRQTLQPSEAGEDWDIHSDWNEVVASIPELDEKLATKLASLKARQILYSPILVCTIDHIMGATEETQRGRHIIPWLRMLSADLVIDEADDFDGNDLVAMMRLVHLAGMLGRKIILSSATIPPAVAESAFEAYRSGWRLFAVSRARNPNVLVAWIDELSGAKTVSLDNGADFSRYHEKHVQARLKKLRQHPVRRKAVIQPVQNDCFGQRVLESMLDLHHNHSQPHNTRAISFGVVRMANITPCVAMARYLLQADLPGDVALRVLPYHSRFPRLVRHNIELLLDAVLKRQQPETALTDPNLVRHLSHIREKNILFVVVATPVEEVGRDHDFDWAVLEPSSIRSLIQMAGRVRRHRPVQELPEPNMVLLSHNINALLNTGAIAYTRPGYESAGHTLVSHDMRDLVDEQMIRERVDAGLRISRPQQLRPTEKLLDLEHHSLDTLLLKGHAGSCDSVPGWNQGPWHLSGMAQRARPFRGGTREASLFLLPVAPNDRLEFHYRDDRSGEMVPWNQWVENVELEATAHSRLWLPVDYIAQLEAMDSRNEGAARLARRFGEISLPAEWLNSYDGAVKFNLNLGLWKSRDLGELFKP